MFTQIRSAFLRKISKGLVELEELRAGKDQDRALFGDMRADEITSLRKTIHRDRKWLSEIREANDYVKIIKREARLHAESCTLNSALCEVCCHFDKRLP